MSDDVLNCSLTLQVVTTHSSIWALRVEFEQLHSVSVSPHGDAAMFFSRQSNWSCVSTYGRNEAGSSTYSASRHNRDDLLQFRSAGSMDCGDYGRQQG